MSTLPHSPPLPTQRPPWSLRGCRALSLDGCRQLPFIDDGLVSLRGLTRVAALNLQGCLTLTDVGLAAIACMKALTSVNLQDCCAITGPHAAS